MLYKILVSVPSLQHLYMANHYNIFNFAFLRLLDVYDTRVIYCVFQF